jgi:hypothetical protein
MRLRIVNLGLSRLPCGDLRCSAGVDFQMPDVPGGPAVAPGRNLLTDLGERAAGFKFLAARPAWR